MIRAQLWIGFRADTTSPFVATWNEAEREAFDEVVRADIYASIPERFRDSWYFLQLDSGGLDGARKGLQLALDRFNADPETKVTLQEDDSAAIEYLYVDGHRVCLWEFGLLREGQHWSIDYAPPGQLAFTAEMVAQIRVGASD